MTEHERPDLSLIGKSEKKFEFSTETRNQALASLQAAGIPTDVRASEAQFEEFYSIAFNMYRSGNFKDAIPFLSILLMGRGTEAKYAFALAACHHMLKEYEKAISFYVLTAILDPKNPLPHYHEADCWINLQETASAYLALFMGIKKASASPEHKSLMDRMVSMQNRLKAEFAEKAKLGITNFRGNAGKEEMAMLEKALQGSDLAALEEMLKNTKE